MKKVVWLIFMLFILITLWERHREMEITGIQKEVECLGGALLCAAAYFFLHRREAAEEIAEAQRKEEEQRRLEAVRKRRKADQALVSGARKVLRGEGTRREKVSNSNGRPQRRNES